jgi:TonB family protein
MEISAVRLWKAAILAVPLLVGGMSGVAHGQEAATPAAPARLQAQLILPGAVAYPQELADQGVQGEALVEVSVAADGVISNPLLRQSSGSPQLDTAALNLVAGKRLGVGPGFNAQNLLIPLVFSRDRVATIPFKSCAEFTQDHAYFVRTFPGREIQEMNVFTMATGMLFSLRGIDTQMLAKLKDAPRATVEACAGSPASSFFEVFAAQTK